MGNAVNEPAVVTEPTTETDTPKPRRWDGKYHRWRCIIDGYDWYYNVGVNRDGTPHNPNGYPEDKLCDLLDRLFEERARRRSDGANTIVNRTVQAARIPAWRKSWRARG